MVTEKEVFEFPAFGVGPVVQWAKISHFILATQQGVQGGYFWFEYLAQRGQEYLLKNKGKQIAKEPIFAPDVEAVAGVMKEAQAARRPAKGTVVPEAAS